MKRNIYTLALLLLIVCFCNAQTSFESFETVFLHSATSKWVEKIGPNPYDYTLPPSTHGDICDQNVLTFQLADHSFESHRCSPHQGYRTGIWSTYVVDSIPYVVFCVEPAFCDTLQVRFHTERNIFFGHDPPDFQGILQPESFFHMNLTYKGTMHLNDSFDGEYQ